MGFNVWTFLFQVVNFLVLVYVLHRLLYRPLHEAIDRRREANAKAQADADRACKEATALQTQLKDQLAALDQKRQELLRSDREQTEAERKAMMAAAEAAAQHRREDLERQLKEERAEALKALHDELVRSAIAMAERFLHESADSTLQKQLAGRLVEELENLPEDERRRLREEVEADGADEAAVVETATDLDQDVLQKLDAALKSLLGRTLKLTVQMQPELMGGIRLRLGGHVWDASLVGGLNEVAPAAQGSLSS